MADAERIGAVIQVDYNGQENVARYIADLERLGVISSYVANRFNQIWSGVATGVIQARDAVAQLNRALAQTGENRGAAFQRFDWAVEGNRRVRTLEASVTALDRAIDRLQRRQTGGAGRVPLGDIESQIRAQFAQVAATQLGIGARGQIGSLSAPAASPQALTEARAQTSAVRAQTAAAERLVRALESPAVVQARQAEIRAVEQNNTELRQLTSALNRIWARQGISSIADADVIAPGTVGSVQASTTIPLFDALNRELRAMEAQMQQILSTSRAITNQERIAYAQQVNAGRIRGLIGGGTKDDYNDQLLDAALGGEAGRVRRGAASYGLLSTGTINRSYGNALGLDALGLLGVDPQQLYGARTTGTVRAPGFIDYRTHPFTTPQEDAAFQIQKQMAQLRADAATGAYGLLPQRPFGAGQGLALRDPSGVVPYGDSVVRFGRDLVGADTALREFVAALRAAAGAAVAGGPAGLLTTGYGGAPFVRGVTSGAGFSTGYGQGFQMLGQAPTTELQSLYRRYYPTGYATPPPRQLPPGPLTGGSLIPLSYNPATGSYGASGYGGGYVGGGGRVPPPPPGPPSLPQADPTGGGFLSQFGYGFRGARDRPYPEQLGQAFKFSVFYGTAYKLLFAITQTFGDALQQAVAFEQATTDLALATGHTTDEVSGIADQLGKTASRAGFSPAEGVEAGARAVGLFGLTGAPLSRQATAANVSAQVTSMLALGNQGRTFQDIQTDLAATTQAFGLGYQGQSYLADLDAFFSKKYGLVSGATLQPIAETAALGSSAGFSLEQQASISALLQSRTGQTPSAVGGLLSQLFSRTGDSTLNSIAGRYGISTQGQTLSRIIGGLAGVYRTAGQPEQNEIAAAFGRGRSQNAAQLLLQNFDQIMGTAKEAQTGSLGLAQKQFEARLNNIGGRIAQLSGAFHEFALQLGATGIINVLGLFVVGLTKALDAVNGVLSLFNLLPGPLRDLLIATGLLTLAFRTGAAQAVLSRGITSGVGGSLFSRAAGVGGYATPIAYGEKGIVAAGAPTLVRGAGLLANPVAASSGLNALAAAGGTATAARAGLLGTSLAAGSSLFAALVNPVTVAIGGLLAIGAVKSAMDRYHAAVTTAEGVLSDFAEQSPQIRDLTPEGLRSYASTLQSQADQVRGSVGGFANFITFGQANNGAEQMADSLQRSARFAGVVADRLEKGTPPTPAVTQLQSLDPEAINTAFTNIANNGGTATQQLRYLSQAIFSVGARADAARRAFRPGRFSNTLAQTAPGFIGDTLAGLPDLQGQNVYISGGRAGGASVPTYVSGDRLRDAFTANNASPDIAGFLRDSLKARGIRSEAELGPHRANLVSGDVAAAIVANTSDFDELIPEAREQLIDAIRKAIRDRILSQSHDARADVHRRTLTRSEATSSANAIAQTLDSQLAGFADTDYTGRGRVLQGSLSKLRRVDQQTPDNVPRLVQAIGDVERQVAENQIENLENLRQANQRNARSANQIAAIGRRALRREIAAAVRGGAQDRLVALLEQAGPYAIELAREAINESLQVAIAAATTIQTVVSYVDTANGQIQKIIDTVKVVGNSPAIRRLRALRESLGGVDSSTRADDVYLHGGDANIPEDVTGDGAQYTAAQRAAAAAAAAAARGGGGVSAARAAVQSAAADLAAEKEGTVAYYQALQSYYEAQQGLTDAIRAYHDVLAQLNIDLTNPLKAANLAVREARRKLEQDIKAGRDPDVIAQDRLDLRNAETEQEATKFQQRLDRAQTADQLGRISHAAYIRYLDNERDRLEGIKNRTYQQQQELNQIDQLLQDAQNQLSGQFNLGDINLPTPYQVRRYMEQSTGGVAGGGGAQTPPTKPPQVNINIDGADTGQIRRILNEILGANGNRSTTSRRKVRS